ncbi:hypothetical protein P7C70_g4976, partial [Phenoliferia sp. Uapishka_3]
MILPDWEEKPLLPFANNNTPAASPPTSRTGSPPPLFKSNPSALDVVRSFLTGKRRLGMTLVVVVYVLGGLAWYHQSHRGFWRDGPRDHSPPLHERPPGRPYQPGDGFESPPLWLGPESLDKEPPKQVPEQAVDTPLTGLGKEADGVYKLGGLNRLAYKAELESFVKTHFPPKDSDERDPHSLLNAMRAYFPDKAHRDPETVLPPIPEKLWQTAATTSDYQNKYDATTTFQSVNGDINVTFQDDKTADSWIRSRFAVEEEDVSKGAALLPTGIVSAWDRLATPAVLRSDFWRYLVLATEGGVYADTDVHCLRPISTWGDDPSWNGKRPDGYRPPSIIVGVEADVGNRHDWHSWWPRPLQFSQWTIASARGHPVLIDSIRRVVEMALLPLPTPLPSVMERTGPGPFTDAVLRYVMIGWNKTWADLRGLGQDGWRWHGEGREGGWGDIKILSITGFSPGVGHMGSEEASHPAAMAKHEFAGSWRGQEGAGAR